MSPNDYGLFAVLLSVIHFINTFQSSFVGYPLIVRGAVLRVEEFRLFAVGALAVSTATAVLLGCIVSVTIGWSQDDLLLGLSVAAALITWQLQQTTRSAFIAKSQYRSAMVGDSLGYLGRAALIWLLTINSETGAFASIAVASTAALCLQLWQLKLFRTTWGMVVHVVRLSWRLGRWTAFGSILGGTILQIFVMGLAWSHGASEVAEYQAIVNVIGVSHPLILSVSSLVMPGVAVAFAAGGLRDAKRAAAERAIPIAMVLAPILIGLALMPNIALEAFYGADSPYASLAPALRWFVLAYIFTFLSNVLGALLNGMERPQSRLMAQVLAIFSAAVIGIPLLATLGTIGASAGLAFANMVAVIANLKFIHYDGKHSSID